MVAAVAVEPAAVLVEAEQAVSVGVRSAADSPVGVLTAALAVSLVAIAAAGAEVLAVPGFAAVSTGDAAVAQLDFARSDSASWKQASSAREDRVVLAGRVGLGCSAANLHAASPGDAAVPVAAHAPAVGLVVVAAAVAGLVAGLELAAAAVVVAAA